MTEGVTVVRERWEMGELGYIYLWVVFVSTDNYSDVVSPQTPLRRTRTPLHVFPLFLPPPPA